MLVLKLKSTNVITIPAIVSKNSDVFKTSDIFSLFATIQWLGVDVLSKQLLIQFRFQT